MWSFQRCARWPSRLRIVSLKRILDKWCGPMKPSYSRASVAGSAHYHMSRPRPLQVIWLPPSKVHHVCGIKEGDFRKRKLAAVGDSNSSGGAADCHPAIAAPYECGCYNHRPMAPAPAPNSTPPTTARIATGTIAVSAKGAPAAATAAALEQLLHQPLPPPMPPPPSLLPPPLPLPPPPPMPPPMHAYTLPWQPCVDKVPVSCTCPQARSVCTA